MTTSTSPDRSVSDDALASGGPAGDGGFDPTKHFKTRDGGEVTNARFDKTWIYGEHEGFHRTWFPKTGKHRWEDARLDLINTPIPTAPPTPAGDMAGEDDDGDPFDLAERLDYALGALRVIASPDCDGKTARAMAKAGLDLAEASPASTLNRDTSDSDTAFVVWASDRIDWPSDIDGDRFTALAREGARREPVAGDGWQLIATAPKDDTDILVWTDEHGALKGRWTHLLGWISQWGFDDWISIEPIYWRPLPSAPGTTPITSSGTTTTLATSSEEALCRALPSAAFPDRFVSGAEFPIKSCPYPDRSPAVAPPATVEEEIGRQIREGLRAASPDGAGSGSEPRYAAGDGRLEGDGLIKLLRSGNADTEAQNDAADWIARLYAAPPACVDAVAVVTEFQASAAKCMTTSKVESSDWSFHSGAQNVCELILAALRARQQATGARS